MERYWTPVWLMVIILMAFQRGESVRMDSMSALYTNTKGDFQTLRSHLNLRMKVTGEHTKPHLPCVTPISRPSSNKNHTEDLAITHTSSQRFLQSMYNQLLSMRKNMDRVTKCAEIMESSRNCELSRKFISEFLRSCKDSTSPFVNIRSKKSLSVNHDLKILSKILEKARNPTPRLYLPPSRFRHLKKIQGRIMKMYRVQQKSRLVDYKERISHKYSDYDKNRIATMLIKLGK